MPILVERVATLGPDLDPLVADAEAEGHLFLRRLRDAWASRENRFDRPGEILLAARIDKKLVGIGGLNIDPFARAQGIGRLRHLYVASDARKRGVGSGLAREILAAARSRFAIVRLRTDSPEAAAFYTRLGFQPTDEPDATHLIRIS